MRTLANKAKLRTDTYTRTYTDTDSALSTSESTEAEPQEKLEPSYPIKEAEARPP